MKRKIVSILLSCLVATTLLSGCALEEVPGAIEEAKNSQAQKEVSSEETSIQEEKPSNKISFEIDGQIDGYNTENKEETSIKEDKVGNDNYSTLVKNIGIAIQENSLHYGAYTSLDYRGTFDKNKNEPSDFENSIFLNFHKNSQASFYLEGQGEYQVGGKLSEDAGTYIIEKYLIDDDCYEVQLDSKTNIRNWNKVKKVDSESFPEIYINRENLLKALNKSSMQEQGDEYIFTIDSTVEEFFDTFNFGKIRDVFNDSTLLAQTMNCTLTVDKNTNLPTHVSASSELNYLTYKMNQSSIWKLTPDMDGSKTLDASLTNISIDIVFDFNEDNPIGLKNKIKYEAEKGSIANSFEYLTGSTKYIFSDIMDSQKEVLATFDSSDTNEVVAVGYNFGGEVDLYSHNKTEESEYLGTMSLASLDELRNVYGYIPRENDLIAIPGENVYEFVYNKTLMVYIEINDYYGLVFSGNNTNYSQENLSLILKYITK